MKISELKELLNRYQSLHGNVDIFRVSEENEAIPLSKENIDTGWLCGSYLNSHFDHNEDDKLILVIKEI